MTTTATLISNIVTSLQTVSNVRQVIYHGGAINDDELNRYSMTAPALVLTHAGVRNATAQPTEPTITSKFSLFVVAKHIVSQPNRHALAQTLVDAVLVRLTQGATWGNADASRPDNIRAENLYAVYFDKKSLAVYAIDWDQTYTLDISPTFDELDDLTLVNVDWELERETAGEIDLGVGEVDANDQIALEPPE